ncbi:arylamine N-acetyltransferase [Rhodococcus sp. NPDC058521]|uniref:arylamine N-acetyltransferase family protein n=1 Tax=Rhodococcus sp. NPDC058521 TaxID=3346536 RepID=UPI0036675927
MTASEDSVDVDRYFQRIGYAGDRTPTLRTLDAIIGRHATAIPFENLDPFMSRPNRIDLVSLQHKLIDSRRGGYCYEQNLLLRSVLMSLGFDVTALAARVLWGADDYAITQRSHMLLAVTLEDGARVVDVGFGGMTMTSSIRFESDVEQSTPLEPFRLTTLGNDFALQAKLDGVWRSIYRFDLTPQHPVDYEASNWYLSTWPHSRFVTGLTVARPSSDRRYALNGLRLTVHHLGGPSERRQLESVEDLRRTLENDLLVDTSGIPLDLVFDRAT